jgi:hypothetical protein
MNSDTLRGYFLQKILMTSVQMPVKYYLVRIYYGEEFNYFQLLYFR